MFSVEQNKGKSKPRKAWRLNRDGSQVATGRVKYQWYLCKWGQGWQIHFCLAKYQHAIKQHWATTKSRAYFDPSPPSGCFIDTLDKTWAKTVQISLLSGHIISSQGSQKQGMRRQQLLSSLIPAYITSGKAQLAPTLPTLCCSGILPVVTINFNHKLQQTQHSELMGTSEKAAKSEIINKVILLPYLHWDFATQIWRVNKLL